MQLGLGGHADREVGPVGPDQLDQLAGVLEVAAGVAAVGRRVAGEGEDVLDPGLGVLVEQLLELVVGVAHAGQVGHGREAGVAFMSMTSSAVRSRVQPPAP